VKQHPCDEQRKGDLRERDRDCREGLLERILDGQE
jgi:hypothetical protein